MPAIPTYSDIDFQSLYDPLNSATPLGGGGGSNISFNAIQPGQLLLRADNNNVDITYFDPGTQDIVWSTPHVDPLGGYNNINGEYTVQRDSFILISTSIKLDSIAGGVSREACRIEVRINPGGGFADYKIYEYYGGDSHDQDSFHILTGYNATAGDLIKVSYFSNAGANQTIDGGVEASYYHIYELNNNLNNDGARLLLDTNNGGTIIVHPANGATFDIANDTASVDPEGGYNTGTGEYTFANDALILAIAQVRSVDTFVGSNGKTQTNIELNTGGGYSIVANYRLSWSDSIFDECNKIVTVLSVSAGDTIKMSFLMDQVQVGWDLSGFGDSTYLQLIELAQLPNDPTDFNRILLQANGGLSHTGADGAEDAIWGTATIDPESAYNVGTGEYTFAKDTEVLMLACTKRGTTGIDASEAWQFEVDPGTGYATVSLGGARYRGSGGSLMHDDQTFFHFDFFTFQAGWTIKTQILFENSGGNPATYSSATNDAYWFLVEIRGGSGYPLIRERLIEPRTYFVDNSTGNDTDDGLTASTAFESLQRAIDVASTLDTANLDITIQLADSDTNATSTGFFARNVPGEGKVIIQGGAATSITLTDADIYALSNLNTKTTYVLKDLRVNINNANAGSVPTGAVLCRGSETKVELDEVTYAATDASSKDVEWLRVEDHGIIDFTGNGDIFVVSGASTQVMMFATSGGIIRCENITFAVGAGTPTFTFFVDCERHGLIEADNTTFSGSANGPRFRVRHNGFISEGTAGAGFLGNAAGTEDTATSGHII